MNRSRTPDAPKPLDVVLIEPPPADQRRTRPRRFAEAGGRKDRYTLPDRLDSTAPVGYRRRVALTPDEARSVLPLLALDRPPSFVEGPAPTERQLFEESSLGVLTARQSTNYRGHQARVLGPADSAALVPLLRQLQGDEAPALDHATHTHVVFTRPYRTPFTFLLTFIGHRPWTSFPGVLRRAWDKRMHHVDDIPSVGSLQHIHVGVLADAVERAAVIASSGRQMAHVIMAPFCGRWASLNCNAIRRIEDAAGLTAADRRLGWKIAFVAQVGHVAPDNRPCPDVPAPLWRKVGANLMAFRSERIQPGVNQEPKAPEAYQQRQDMDVPEALTVQCGRALYNAFSHWTGLDREVAKELVLMERIDVLTPNGKERLRQVRAMLDEVTERVVSGIPLWADLPTGKALSRNAARGRKAFGLAGQRIYIGGLSRSELEAQGVDWCLAQRAFGAASSRSALLAELMGVTAMPDDCDLLAGICLMAGPVNQNDIGKAFYGHPDLLTQAFPDRDPTSLLVWTLKAKTVADPIGNEEQLLNPERKGALVDLRPGPHDVVRLRVGATWQPMRQVGDRVNRERAFGEVGNFECAADGRPIEGNAGDAWPAHLAERSPWAG
jgi:hypothetical protein